MALIAERRSPRALHSSPLLPHLGRVHVARVAVSEPEACQVCRLRADVAQEEGGRVHDHTVHHDPRWHRALAQARRARFVVVGAAAASVVGRARDRDEPDEAAQHQRAPQRLGGLVAAHPFARKARAAAVLSVRACVRPAERMSCAALARGTIQMVLDLKGAASSGQSRSERGHAQGVELLGGLRQAVTVQRHKEQVAAAVA